MKLSTRFNISQNLIKKELHSNNIIFIGPMKTGTTSLYNDLRYLGILSNGSKEILLPKINWIAKITLRNYLKTSKVIVWPYLIHKPKKLRQLIKLLYDLNIQFDLILTDRIYDNWMKSLNNHDEWYGKPVIFRKDHESEIKKSLAVIASLNCKIHVMDYIDERDKMINTICEALGENSNHMESVLSFSNKHPKDIKKRSFIYWLAVRIYFGIKFIHPEFFESLGKLFTKRK